MKDFGEWFADPTRRVVAPPPQTQTAQVVDVQVWCETCEGTGKVHQEHQRGVVGSGGTVTCPDCDGNGYIVRKFATLATTEGKAR